ncbi:MAG: hypothetical protein JSS02_32215, partial [Planctomycetes bacterium]|nr:hypothetical protein [Planctomycetota bacterium]
MIRPYLAILKDSYREALASRVLAILLIIITIVLLLLAPVGLRDKQATRLNRSSVRNWPNLANKIQSQAAAEGPSVGKVVFSRFGEPVKKQLAEAAEQSAGEMSGDTISAFVKDLNQVI